MHSTRKNAKMHSFRKYTKMHLRKTQSKKCTYKNLGLTERSITDRSWSVTWTFTDHSSTVTDRPWICEIIVKTEFSLTVTLPGLRVSSFIWSVLFKTSFSQSFFCTWLNWNVLDSLKELIKSHHSSFKLFLNRVWSNFELILSQFRPNLAYF